MVACRGSGARGASVHTIERALRPAGRRATARVDDARIASRHGRSARGRRFGFAHFRANGVVRRPKSDRSSKKFCRRFIRPHGALPACPRAAKECRACAARFDACDENVGKNAILFFSHARWHATRMRATHMRRGVDGALHVRVRISLRTRKPSRGVDSRKKRD